jgi:hypothetical protein
LSAQKDEPKPWEGRAACVTCPIGAANSGQEISPVAEDVAVLSKICPRCLHQAERIINDNLCVSCYNRAREAHLGRNAKGGIPRLCHVLHTEDFAAVEGETPHYVAASSVTSMVEAILAHSKRAKDTVAYSVPRVIGFEEERASRQMEIENCFGHAVKPLHRRPVPRAMVFDGLAVQQMELAI